MKRFRRDIAANLLVSFRLLSVVSAIGSARSPVDIKVLAYHRVVPKVDEATFFYDLELISAWQEEFDWQVALLARDYNVITCRDLAALLDQGRPVPKRTVIVTFDDGYRDNHSVALPILRTHKVPAVIFVATGMMDSEETFWYDRLLHDVVCTSASTVTLECTGEVIALGADIAARREAARTILKRLKTLPNQQRLDFLARVRDELAVPAPKVKPEFDGPMSWAQVRDLSNAGIEIGSHSVTHPVLSRLNDPEQLKRELTESKSAIEAQTGAPVISLAYPVGGRTAYDETVITAAREAGYRFAFAYHAGPNRVGAFDPYRMRRLSVERYVSRNRFSAMLAAPSLFAFGWSSA